MKKKTIIVLTAALLVAPAMAADQQSAPTTVADLEAQMLGYWQLDVERALEKARRSEKEIDSSPASLAEEISDALVELVLPEILPRFLLEIQKGKVMIHGPGVKDSATYTLKSQDKVSNTLTMELTDEAGTSPGAATIEGDQLTFKKNGEVMVFNRISKKEFEKRLGIGVEGADAPVEPRTVEGVGDDP